MAMRSKLMQLLKDFTGAIDERVRMPAVCTHCNTQPEWASTINRAIAVQKWSVFWLIGSLLTAFAFGLFSVVALSQGDASFEMQALYYCVPILALAIASFITSIILPKRRLRAAKTKLSELLGLEKDMPTICISEEQLKNAMNALIPEGQVSPALPTLWYRGTWISNGTLSGKFEPKE